VPPVYCSTATSSGDAAIGAGAPLAASRRSNVRCRASFGARPIAGALEQPVGDAFQRRQRACDRAGDDVAHPHLARDLQHARMDFPDVAGRYDLRARILDEVRQLALDIERVDVDDDPAGPERREEQDGIIGRVRQAERDARTLDDTQILQSARSMRHRLAQFGIGHRAAQEIEHGPPPEARHRLVEHRAEQPRALHHRHARRAPVCIHHGLSLSIRLSHRLIL
jgi:hypothetical protein